MQKISDSARDIIKRVGAAAQMPLFTLQRAKLLLVLLFAGAVTLLESISRKRGNIILCDANIFPTLF